MAEKMLNIIPGFLGLLAFGALLVTWIVETILSARWDKRYFGAGVPIFVLNVPVKDHVANIPSCQLLESNFRANGFIRNTSLLFKEVDVNTLGFRESLLQFGQWYSIMHGLLIFDYERSQVVVKGFFDWTHICFSLLFLITGPLIWFLGFIPFDGPIWLIAIGYFGFLIAITAIFCLIDYFRFSKVAKFAAQAWSR